MSAPNPPGSPPPPPPGSPPRRTTSGSHKVISAARTAPISKTPTDPGQLKAIIKSQAENVGLNAVAALKDTVTDFRQSSRYFKYKALIAAVWVVLSASGVVVAWPAADVNNDLGAKLYPASTGSNVFMVKNESEEQWVDVQIIVNKTYRLFVPNLDPQRDVTFNPKQLTGPNGVVAPADLDIRDIELKTKHGLSKLLENGRLVDE